MSWHGVLESEEGSRHPVSPLGTRVGPPVRWEPADLDEVYRLIGPQPPSSAEPIRIPGPWLWYGNQREQGMVLGQADIGARVPLGAALARDDVAGEHVLAAENLQAEPLTVRVAAVAG